MMHELPSVRTKEVDAGEIHIKRTSNPDLEVHRHVSNVRFDVEISKNGELIDKYEEDHAVRFFFPQELKKYLEDAGFEVLDICKLFEPGTTVSVKDWNMSIIARAK